MDKLLNELIAAINRLAAAIESTPKDTSSTTKPPKSSASKSGGKKAASSASEETAPVATEESPAPAASEAPANVDRNEVGKLILKIAGSKAEGQGRDVAIGIMKEHGGAEKLPDVAEAKLGAVYVAAKKVLGEE